MPATKPPAAMLPPLLVLIVIGAPPLKLMVTGNPVFASKMFIHINADSLTGMLVVAWIAFGVPSPTSDAMIKLNGRSARRAPTPQCRNHRASGKRHCSPQQGRGFGQPARWVVHRHKSPIRNVLSAICCVIGNHRHAPRICGNKRQLLLALAVIVASCILESPCAPCR